MALEREAFCRSEAGDEIPTDVIRFAVGTSETGIRSTVWRVYNSRNEAKDDMFMETSGLSNDIKISFHSKDAVVAYRSESVPCLIDRQIIPPDTKRQMNLVPILSSSFMVAKVDFRPSLLIPAEKGRPIDAGKSLSLFPPPLPGNALCVFAVHSFDNPTEFVTESGVLRWFARLRNGNRHLTFFHQSVPAPEPFAGTISLDDRDGVREVAARGNLSGILWGVEGDHLAFIEAHNIQPDRTAFQSDRSVPNN